MAFLNTAEPWTFSVSGEERRSIRPVEGIHPLLFPSRSTHCPYIYLPGTDEHLLPREIYVNNCYFLTLVVYSYLFKRADPSILAEESCFKSCQKTGNSCFFNIMYSYVPLPLLVFQSHV